MSAEIAITWPFPGDFVERLRGLHAARIRRDTDPLDETGLAEFIGRAEAVVTLLADPMTDRVMAACPHLRVVANCAVGYDNVDLEAARRRRIWVTNTPDVLTEATADLAWALILAVTRRVVEGDAMVRDGSFHGWRPDLLLGTGLQGKTLGIIGYGRIGQAVARRALGFGMDVAYVDSEERPIPAVSARRVPLEELLATSRVVSVHCPLTPETHHLLDEGNLRLLPRGAFVVNTARGSVIDEGALVSALDSGRLGGAGLDVYEDEPHVHPGLLGRTNVVLLPHVGSATRETRTAMAELAVENAVAVLDGREPPTPVIRGG